MCGKCKKYDKLKQTGSRRRMVAGECNRECKRGEQARQRERLWKYVYSKLYGKVDFSQQGHTCSLGLSQSDCRK